MDKPDVFNLMAAILTAGSVSGIGNEVSAEHMAKKYVEIRDEMVKAIRASNAQKR